MRYQSGTLGMDTFAENLRHERKQMGIKSPTGPKSLQFRVGNRAKILEDYYLLIFDIGFCVVMPNNYCMSFHL